MKKILKISAFLTVLLVGFFAYGVSDVFSCYSGEMDFCNIFGCTDPKATNYNFKAIIDDGSCIYPVLGCTDPTALNYNAEATKDDGSCAYPILGCTDSEAINYNPIATTDDGSCEYLEPELYSISGKKFNDLNNNGINDNEPGIEGWTITISKEGKTIKSTLTDSQGNYYFSGLASGIYTVCEESQANWTKTYPTQDCYVIELKEQTQYSDSCPLLSKTGRIIIEFENTRLYSDRGESKAMSLPVSTLIPADKYTISYVSYDAHSEHPGQYQPNESWYLILKNSQGNIVLNTASTADLPDNQDWITGILQENLIIGQDIASVIARHSAYPNSNPNSIDPICVAFDYELSGFDFGNYYEVLGCTDPEALNYNSEATADDGSCEYPVPEVPGCTDLEAINYNPDATVDDGSCIYHVYGCTDPSALNYNAEATKDDGSCEYPIKPLIIKAYKVVCDKEENLPNWTDGGAPSIISETTALDYVSQSNGVCQIEADWDFQWGYSNVPKLDGDYIGKASIETGWKNFNSLTSIDEPAIAQIYDLQSTSKIWVREVLKEGYIPFTNPPKGVAEDNFSAEIYCHTDILNYDNYDYIISPELGKTYYCIAFNALKEIEILGCTDPEALNYNSEATVDDGSCEYPVPEKYSIFGMKFNDLNNNGINDLEPGLANWTILLTDSNSLGSSVVTDSEGNYSFLNLEPGIYTVCEEAKDNWTQTYPAGDNNCHIVELVNSNINEIDFGNYFQEPAISGCTDPSALNYNSEATVDDGSCEYPVPNIYGCTDPEAVNYNPIANIDNGTCIYPILGCTDPAALNYNSSANKNDGSCKYGGGVLGEYLVISKTVEQDFTNPGATISYTIKMENIRDITILDLLLKDELPEGFSYKEEGEFDGEMSFEKLEYGEIKTITYDVVVGENVEKGFYENTATLSSSNYKTVSDSAKIEVRVPEVKGEEFLPQLTINKTVNKNSVTAGSYVIYEIEVKNIGEAPAVNIVIEDNLPQGFMTTQGLSTLKWEIPLLQMGESWKQSFEVYVPSDTKNGIYKNRAETYGENHPQKLASEVIVAVGTLPWTAGENFFDSNYFVFVGVMFIFAVLGLLKTAIKNTKYKYVFFGSVLIVSFGLLVYPFFPVIEYSVLGENYEQENIKIEETEKISEEEIKVLSQNSEGVSLSAPSEKRDTKDYLLIPKINVKIPIIQGLDESALEKGAWLLPQTATPNMLKNTVLAGHRYKYRPPHKETFYLLDKVSIGDEIIINWKGKEYKYLTTYSIIVEPDNLDYLQETETPSITLITCTPLFSDKLRLIVRGELIQN